jgi:hypothetical protein
MGNIYETPLAEILTSDKFIDDKAAKMSCDLNRVPKTCLSCECRCLRYFFEEIKNTREKIFLKKPLKNIFWKFFGISVMIYERINRNNIFHSLFWKYMCIKSKKIHDAFRIKQLRNAGEKL